MCEDDQHIKLLKGLRGVIDAFYLDDKIKAEVQAEENTVKACGGITVCNLGYMEALKREKDEKGKVTAKITTTAKILWLIYA